MSDINRFINVFKYKKYGTVFVDSYSERCQADLHNIRSADKIACIELSEIEIGHGLCAADKVKLEKQE